MPRDEELPIIRAFYDFALWLSPKIAKFPRDQRFVLGERMPPGMGVPAKSSNSGQSKRRFRLDRCWSLAKSCPWQTW